MTRKKVLIIANYGLDKQKSMIKYADVLKNIIDDNYEVTILAPKAILAALFEKSIPFSFEGYVDKLILFPLYLFVYSRRFDFIHICDHSNAFYIFSCPRDRTIVTCHDVLAIMGAFGDHSTYCQSSWLGKFLQAMILMGLRYCRNIIFVSHSTRMDYQKIFKGYKHKKIHTIYNPLNHNFSVKDGENFPTILEELGIENKRYLLMVGSALPRKNRENTIRALDMIKDRGKYTLVIAGEPPTQDQCQLICDLNLQNRVVSISNPSNSELNDIYIHAHGLLFCSFSEGFGWPIIEAQACHCPVVVSSCSASPEVAGDGALICNPHDIKEIAKNILMLEDIQLRRSVISAGLVNLQRFNWDTAQAKYLEFYQWVESSFGP